MRSALLFVTCLIACSPLHAQSGMPVSAAAAAAIFFDAIYAVPSVASVRRAVKIRVIFPAAARAFIPRFSASQEIVRDDRSAWSTHPANAP